MPASGAVVTILPIRLEDGSGAAARIVGEYNTDEEEPCNGGSTREKGQGLLLVLLIAAFGY